MLPQVAGLIARGKARETQKGGQLMENPPAEQSQGQANTGTPVPRHPAAHPCRCRGIAPTPGTHAPPVQYPHRRHLLTNVMMPMRLRS